MGLEPSFSGRRPDRASDQFGSVLTIDATTGSRPRAGVSAPIVCERIRRVYHLRAPRALYYFLLILLFGCRHSCKGHQGRSSRSIGPVPQWVSRERRRLGRVELSALAV